MPEQITAWGSAIEQSLSHALSLAFAAVPQVIGFIIIIGVGWVVAAVIARVAEEILRRLRFNDMAHRAGLAEAVDQSGLGTDAIGFVTLSVRWFIRLIALVVAFDALGLAAVSDTLRQLLLWLPNLVVALIILVLGGLAANAVRRLVRASTAASDMGDPRIVSGLAFGAVWAFTIVAAVYQVGIASELVATLFAALLAGIALAIGLAFGLGGRDTAAEIVHDLYARLRGPSHPTVKRTGTAGRIASGRDH